MFEFQTSERQLHVGCVVPIIVDVLTAHHFALVVVQHVLARSCVATLRFDNVKPGSRHSSEKVVGTPLSSC